MVTRPYAGPLTWYNEFCVKNAMIRSSSTPFPLYHLRRAALGTLLRIRRRTSSPSVTFFDTIVSCSVVGRHQKFKRETRKKEKKVINICIYVLRWKDGTLNPGQGSLCLSFGLHICVSPMVKANSMAPITSAPLKLLFSLFQIPFSKWLSCSTLHFPDPS